MSSLVFAGVSLAVIAAIGAPLVWYGSRPDRSAREQSNASVLSEQRQPDSE